MAATVCENKDKPKSCCEAKCHLEKEIKKEDKRQSDTSNNIKEKSERTELIPEGIKLRFFQNILLQSIHSLFKQALPFEFVYSVFHPPTLI